MRTSASLRGTICRHPDHLHLLMTLANHTKGLKLGRCFKHKNAMALSCLLRKAIKGSTTSSWVLRLSLDMRDGVVDLYKGSLVK